MDKVLSETGVDKVKPHVGAQEAVKMQDSSNEQNSNFDGSQARVMEPLSSRATDRIATEAEGNFTKMQATNCIMQSSMTAPVLVLTTNIQKGTVEASVLLDPSSNLPVSYPWNIHSLAQANLISETQHEIAKQLMEETKKSESKKGKESAADVQEQTNATNKCTTKRYQEGSQESQTERKRIAIIEPRPNEPKLFVCSYKGCGRRFAWLAHFKYHQLTHTNDRRFACETEGCGKRFLTAQRLQVHMRTHTGERPFVCPAEDCGKSFTTAGNLKNHSRLHTGERPYRCEYCGRSFAEYSSLHKHTVMHLGVKPFTCSICGKGFSQSGSRNVHMEGHKLEEAKLSGQNSTNGINDSAITSVHSSNDSKEGLAVKVEAPTDVLVLCDSNDDAVQYQDLHNAESIMFPQGLADHVVTVTTQPAEGEIAHDVLVAEEVLSDDRLSDHQMGHSVVVLSQPAEMTSIPSSYNDDGLSVTHADTSSYDHTQLLHPVLHHEEITTSDDHDLGYPSLEVQPQGQHDAQSVVREMASGVGSSSSPRSSQNIHMDPMMASDEEPDSTDKT